MKKLLTAFIIILMLSLPLIAEGQKDAGTSEKMMYADGIYFAQEDQFNAKTGWKYNVTLEVEGGKIVEAVWERGPSEGRKR